MGTKGKNKPYSVLVIDNFHLDPEEDYIIDGFPTLELAKEFARRRTRATIEEFRKEGKSKEEIIKLWHTFGESCSVLGGGYAASSELDFFIENPATKEEIDWIAVKKEAGIE